MSFPLFNQDTDLKKSPSPYPLPQERKKEADLPGEPRRAGAGSLPQERTKEADLPGEPRRAGAGSLPQERKKEADLPGKGGARPESKGEKNFLSWGRAIMAAPPPGNG